MALLQQLNLKPTTGMRARHQAATEAEHADAALLGQIKQAFEASKAHGRGAEAEQVLALIKTAHEQRKKAQAMADAAQRAELLKEASAQLAQQLEATRRRGKPGDKTSAVHEGRAAPRAHADSAGTAPSAAPPRSAAPAASATPTPAASNSSGKSSGKKRAGKTITFDESEAVEIIVPLAQGLPGDTGEQQIKDLIQQLRDDVQDFWNIYARGLDNFQTTMSFASNAETEAKYLQVTLKTVGKKALDLALDEAGKKLGGPWGTVISTAKGLVEAWVAESERVAAAEGQVKIRDYIIALRSGISGQQKKLTDTIEGAKRPMIEEFRRLAEGDSTKGQASPQGVVVGEAAALINSLRQAVQSFHAKMPSESYFQQQFTKNFADTPGLSDLISHGGVPTGRIYFGISIYIDPTQDEARPTVKIKDHDESWKLVTKAPNPDRVADSLFQSLDGKKVWQIELTKKVKLLLEIEESGLNSYVEGWINFDSTPDQFSIGTNYSKKWLQWAWEQPQIRKVALDTAKLTGGSDY